MINKFTFAVSFILFFPVTLDLPLQNKLNILYNQTKGKVIHTKKSIKIIFGEVHSFLSTVSNFCFAYKCEQIVGLAGEIADYS